jgi:hypothetical protein
MVMNRDEMINVLKNGNVDIEFVKANGEYRQMLATLREDLLPATKGTGKAINPDVITVLDLDNNEWRAIRVDSIFKFVAV